MATTAIWKVKGNLGRVVGYAANPDKTENPAFTAQDLQGLRDVMDYATQDYKTERQHYVSGINCAPEIARDECQMVNSSTARRADHRLPRLPVLRSRRGHTGTGP